MYHTLVSDRGQYIVWGVGPINADGVVAKHSKRTQGNIQINFARSPENNCKPLRAGSQVALPAWPPHSLLGSTTDTFTFRIGPTGGERGYTALTGTTAWGVAYYVNDILIPELVLKRGVTYTFVVQTGNNANFTAEYHPVYITDDPNGGYVQQTNYSYYIAYGIGSDGRPLADATGTLCEWQTDGARSPDFYSTFDAYKEQNLRLACVQPQRQGAFKWTPDASTPSELYYQHASHQGIR
ncbi:PREDICTED: protein Skeletor, isoforms B/C-like [Priapulus caudatus]|uniref:Protein Skeletor, isoforms B/C-like n=1 Tax=Priapulus caudatus TaxID=37621 RepID=A0ABM1DQP2_PRICU|nr:PREDICTED: protein Skeletor, isoforms B/C-like [Priapulus caudatus]